MRIALRVLIVAIGLLCIEYFVPGISIENFYAALIAAIVLGLLNLIVRPVLIVLTLPITILTLGLFIFVINAALFLLAASFIGGFSVDGFVSALLGSVLLSLVSLMANRVTA